MDEQSAADFIILQEIANNVDAYQKSLHVTKYPIYPSNDLVHMGPIWDLDLAFGNYAEVPSNGPLNYDEKTMGAYTYAVCETNQWRMERAGYFGPLMEMWKLPQFRWAIYNRWWALRNIVTISRTGIEKKIDDFAARITNARIRDNRKWDILGKRTWWECWNKPGPNGMAMYQAEVTELKQWIRARITWMDARFSESSFRNP